MSRLHPMGRFADRACPISLSLPGGRVVNLRAFAGEPFVLALFAQGGAAAALETSLSDLGHELRGLGTALLAISPAGVWCFRPENKLEIFAHAGELCDIELGGVLADYGLTSDEEESGSRAGVYIIDHELRVVFAWRQGNDEPAVGLRMALAASRRELSARPCFEVEPASATLRTDRTMVTT
jgi:peroxiredoxin